MPHPPRAAFTPHGRLRRTATLTQREAAKAECPWACGAPVERKARLPVPAVVAGTGTPSWCSALPGSVRFQRSGLVNPVETGWGDCGCLHRP